MFVSRKQLWWAVWRVEFKATGATTLFLFFWVVYVFGVAAVVHVAAEEFGFQPPKLFRGKECTAVGVGFLVLLFAGGVGGSLYLRRWFFRRYGVQCPGCKYRLRDTRKERRTISSGRCPKCGAALTGDASSPSTFGS